MLQSVIDLGECSIPKLYVDEANAAPEFSPGGRWRSTYPIVVAVSKFTTKDKNLQSLIDPSFADITKFWAVPTHTDPGYKNQHLVVVPENDFIFTFNGVDHPVKAGRAYLFNQNKKHSAHNNESPFICASFPVSRNRLKKFLAQTSQSF